MRNSLAGHQMDRHMSVDDVLGGSDPDRFIITTIRATLNDVFGKRVITSFNKAMRAHSLRWEEIPDNPRLFSELLTKIVGRGHIILEDLILENLYREIGLPYDYVEGCEFHGHIEKIRSGH